MVLVSIIIYKIHNQIQYLLCIQHVQTTKFWTLQMVFLVKTVFSMQFNVLFMWQNSICQNKNAPQWNLEGQVIRPKTMKQNGLFLTEKKTIKNWIKFDWFFIVDKWNECAKEMYFMVCTTNVLIQQKKVFPFVIYYLGSKKPQMSKGKRICFFTNNPFEILLGEILEKNY